MARWYYNDGKTQHGPMDLEGLRGAFEAGTVTPTTMVWREGWDNWTQARAVKELKSASGPAPRGGVTRTRSASLPRVDSASRAPAAPSATPNVPSASAQRGTAPHPASVPAAAPSTPAATPTRTAGAGGLAEVPHKFAAFGDRMLGNLRPIASEARLSNIDQLSDRIGGVAGLAAIALAVLSGAIAAIKLERMSPLTDAVYILFFGAVTLYVGRRLIAANKRLLQQSQHRMSSADFLDSVGALLLAGGLVFFVQAVVRAIQVESFNPLLSGAGVCLTTGIVGLLCLSPSTINIRVEEETHQGEDAIAILCLLPKCVLRVVPVLLMVGTAIASVYFLLSVVALFDDNSFAAAAEFRSNWMEGITSYLAATLLPLGSYLAFIVLTLSLDVMRAVLVLPGALGRADD